MAAWNFRDLVGQRFGRYLVIGRAAKRGKHVMWRCACDCGTETEVYASNLVGGTSNSCGCLKPEATRVSKTTHGRTRTSIYNIYQSMVARCSKPCNNKHFERGIKVCSRWALGENGMTGFDCFLADMGDRPSTDFSIERMDNDGDYTPANCAWATRKRQNRNTTRTAWVSYGSEILSLAEAVEIFGLSRHKMSKYRISPPSARRA